MSSRRVNNLNSREVIQPEIEERSKPIGVRGRSFSFSASPNRTTAFSSQPESPAQKFLSQFLCKDDTYEMRDFEEGYTLNRYMLGRIIGSGAYSECREAYSLDGNSSTNNLPDKVAIKIISDPRYFSDFRSETELWSTIHHENILPLLDRFSGRNYLAAVSIIAENGNLQNFIFNNGAFEENIACYIFNQIVSGLRYLHEECKIVHLDLKLENILLRKNFKVYICDFGMSKNAEAIRSETSSKCSDDPKDQFCCGSLASLPPEAFSLENLNMDLYDTKQKQDIWALGVILYAMLTAKLPFSDDFIPRLQHQIIHSDYEPLDESFSFDARCLISKLLSKDPKGRPTIRDISSDDWLKRYSNFSINTYLEDHYYK